MPANTVTQFKEAGESIKMIGKWYFILMGIFFLAGILTSRGIIPKPTGIGTLGIILGGSLLLWGIETLPQFRRLYENFKQIKTEKERAEISNYYDHNFMVRFWAWKMLDLSSRTWNVQALNPLRRVYVFLYTSKSMQLLWITGGILLIAFGTYSFFLVW